MAPNEGFHLLHQPVLLKEAVSCLITRADGFYADCTFGRGGHSRAILGQLNEEGHLLAVDKDVQAENAARELTAKDRRFQFCRGSFADLRQFVRHLNWHCLDGVLLDLGVSSPQLDDAARGFSFQKEGPLDMRMDTTQGESAADWLKNAGEEDIAKVLWEFGEERYSRRIAKAIVQVRELESIRTTTQLAAIVAQAHPRWEKGKHPATRTFQAIRIHINTELEDLRSALDEIFALLASGGRLVAISFHSLEDRVVKQFMQQKVKGPDLPKWVLLTDNEAPKARILAKKIRAGEKEVSRNIRARSAVMRVLEKL